MPEFLTLLAPHQALDRLMSALPPPPKEGEWVESADALDRVTEADVLAPESLPSFNRSTVDGYAIYASDSFGASESLPAYLALAGVIPMGAPAGIVITRGQAAAIHTGGMLPEGANAVVMVEQTQVSRAGEIEVLRAVGEGENVLKVGEDVQAGDVVIPAGVRLRPAEIGGLMALGLTRVRVVRRPRVGILSSGDEVVPPGVAPKPGQVRDVNSYGLSALVNETGGLALRYGIVPDQEQAMKDALGQALRECELVVITAGSSASTRDLTARVIGQMGAPGVLVHGVNVRPGKPTILGVCDNKAVIGLPGNPVSALVIAGLFVVPVCEHLLGLRQRRQKSVITARLTINLASQAGREDFVPVRLVESEQGLAAEPIFFKSNLIFSLARADGLVHIPADATGLQVGEEVEVRYL